MIRYAHVGTQQWNIPPMASLIDVLDGLDAGSGAQVEGS
jgi:hypothetical protein